MHAYTQVPDVVWGATNERVLTMEFVESFKLTDISRVEAEGLDKEVTYMHACMPYIHT